MIDACYGLGLGHGSRVMRVTGQLTDGSRGSRVTKCALCPSAHVNDIVAKAHKRAYMIQLAFVSRNIDLLVRAYFSLCYASW